MASKMECVLVTGANAGLGFETCKQMATDHGVAKIILACRNQTKADAAVESLAELTGKPASTFEVLILDAGDVASCRAAAEALTTPLNGLVLNAGGMAGFTGKLTADGVTDSFAVNVLGQAVFLEAVLAAGKLADGARVVYASSEAARGISLMKMACPVYEKRDADCVASFIDGRNVSAVL